MFKFAFLEKEKKFSESATNPFFLLVKLLMLSTFDEVTYSSA
jgi:hypothetical protein